MSQFIQNAYLPIYSDPGSLPLILQCNLFFFPPSFFIDIQSLAMFNSVKMANMDYASVQSYWTLWPPRTVTCQAPSPWDFPAKNTRVGCHFLHQGIFPTQGLNLCLLHCRWIFYHWAIREATWTDRFYYSVFFSLFI